MANSNPIKTKDPGNYPDFYLPRSQEDKVLYIMTITRLEQTGWELDLIHALRCNAKPINFEVDASGDIKKQEIGKFSDIIGKKFSLVSIAGRIKNGGQGDPASASYTLEFIDEKDMTLESFPASSGKANPATFYTKITFRLEP